MSALGRLLFDEFFFFLVPGFDENRQERFIPKRWYIISKRDGTRKRLEKKIRNQTSSSSAPFENDTEDDQLQRMSDSDSDYHVMEHSDNHAEATKKKRLLFLPKSTPILPG